MDRAALTTAVKQEASRLGQAVRLFTRIATTSTRIAVGWTPATAP
jgi:hypothetical protein